MSCFNQKLNEVYNFLKSGRRISDRTLFSDGTNVQLFLISYREIIHNKAETGDKKAFLLICIITIRNNFILILN